MTTELIEIWVSRNMITMDEDVEKYHEEGFYTTTEVIREKLERRGKKVSIRTLQRLTDKVESLQIGGTLLLNTNQVLKHYKII